MVADTATTQRPGAASESDHVLPPSEVTYVPPYVDTTAWVEEVPATPAPALGLDDDAPAVRIVHVVPPSALASA